MTLVGYGNPIGKDIFSTVGNRVIGLKRSLNPYLNVVRSSGNHLLQKC